MLQYRKKPIAISSRAVIRAGKGHKYWSRFETGSAERIEKLAKQIHVLLFDPEITSPIKTLDLPLGGSKGIRTALQVLIDYFSIASSSSTNKNVKIDSADDDGDGSATIEVLKKALNLAQRITGNDISSLGLHPAIYFYGPSGVHSLPMFLGTCKLISEKISNNDTQFFKKFTVHRQKIESALVIHKDLIATILQKTGSTKRVNAYYSLLKSLIENIEKGLEVNQEKMIEWGNVRGRVLIGEEITGAINFSDETKSKVFIHNSLSSAIRCPICQGYLDATKSISYDHLIDKKHGGGGHETNLQMTHPYCNSSKHELLKLIADQAKSIAE